jgi:hypothetical protein
MSSEHSRGTDVLRLCPQIIHTYTVANTYTGAKDSVSIEWSVGPLRIDKGITCATGPVEGQTAPEDASMTVEQDEASLNSAYSAALTELYSAVKLKAAWETIWRQERDDYETGLSPRDGLAKWSSHIRDVAGKLIREESSLAILTSDSIKVDEAINVLIRYSG